VAKKNNDTVDGRNPAPPGMYNTLQTMGETTYQLVQDFFHQHSFGSTTTALKQLVTC